MPKRSLGSLRDRPIRKAAYETRRPREARVRTMQGARGRAELPSHRITECSRGTLLISVRKGACTNTLHRPM